MKKFIVLFALVLALVPIQSVHAQIEQPVDTRPRIEMPGVPIYSFFDIRENPYVTPDGIDGILLRTFSSQSDAIDLVYELCPHLLGYLQIHNGFERLSESNWEAYKSAMYEVEDPKLLNIDYEQFNDEFSHLQFFFDIFENKYHNELVLSRLLQNNFNLEAVVDLLPYTCSYVEERYMLGEQEYNLKASATSQVPHLERTGSYTDKSIAYATKYAHEANTSNYFEFDADCTNFVSQILAAGGRVQNRTGSKYSGWWHAYNQNTKRHTHSNSWINANAFVKYFGIRYKTKSHFDFSDHIFKGDPIALDFGNDDVWDHVGFVTAADNYIGSYGYYDYKVAQHTKNYHAWTSSDVNGWETIKGATYARIKK